MHPLLKRIFNSKAKTVASIEELISQSYNTLCHQYWQADQYNHVKKDEGTSVSLKRDENDLKHPDRPSWLSPYTRTEFQSNEALFRGIDVTHHWKLELEDIKAGWLKGEAQKTIKWYFDNLARAHHPDLNVSLSGFDLFEDPAKLEALDDNARLSLELKIDMRGKPQETKPHQCSFMDEHGKSLFDLNVNAPAHLDPLNSKDLHYIGMYALHLLAMRKNSETDRVDILNIENVMIGNQLVSVEDVHSFTLEEDKGPKSQYPGLQGYRNKLANFYPKFG